MNFSFYHRSKSQFWCRCDPTAFATTTATTHAEEPVIFADNFPLENAFVFFSPRAKDVLHFRFHLSVGFVSGISNRRYDDIPLNSENA